MLRHTITALVLACAPLLATQATAQIITTGGIAAGDGSGLTTGVDGAIVETFDGGVNLSGGLVQPWDWTTSDASLHIVSGSQPGIYAAPHENETHYLSVAEEVPGWAQVDFGITFNYLGLYWGSIDEYNILELLKDDTTVATVMGGDVIDPADGDQGPDGSAYVNLTGVSFDGARFTSTEYAFEFDNLAVALPVPASAALFGVGLLGLGLVAQRKRRFDD